MCGSHLDGDEEKKWLYNSQRGVGRGQWGEGLSGTTIKDTWTKRRGRVEAGEGGGFGWGGRKCRQL